jgi:uncharacterized protein YdaU (DUF1376 family)
VTAVRALYWWIDRWRKSTAFTDMTLAEQGAYRNLLDEATLRNGRLPTNEKILAKACGDATSWKQVRKAVLKKFIRTPEFWRNPTLDAILHQSQRRIDKQRAYRERLGNALGNGAGNKARNKPGSPDPDPDIKKNPPISPLSKGGRLTQRELKAATQRRNRIHGGCPHHPRHQTAAACVKALALEARIGRES